MIELISNRPSSTTIAFAMGTAVLTAQPPYPERLEPYEVQQVRGSYSDFIANLSKTAGIEKFAIHISEIYGALVDRQELLGKEFELAIFSDLENLYEA